MSRLIRCPFDYESFDTVTEFITHCHKKHESILLREADAICVKTLTRELEFFRIASGGKTA